MFTIVPIDPVSNDQQDLFSRERRIRILYFWRFLFPIHRICMYCLKKDLIFLMCLKNPWPVYTSRRALSCPVLNLGSLFGESLEIIAFECQISVMLGMLAFVWS